MAGRIAATVDHLRAGGDYVALPWFSSGVGPRGSYRLEHVLAYMRRHLQVMLPGRQWRIIMCNVCSAHLGQEVIRCANERGYVAVFRGGGCTGVLQCNDTQDLTEQ